MISQRGIWDGYMTYQHRWAWYILPQLENLGQHRWDVPQYTGTCPGQYVISGKRGYSHFPISEISDLYLSYPTLSNLSISLHLPYSLMWCDDLCDLRH